jgi:hypothetical protein
MTQNTQQKTYTKEQHELIAEFAATYGLEPEQIRFYSDDPQPFFDRDATAVLIHKLTSAVGIEDEPMASPLGDAIAVKYRITFEDGTFASSTGIANVNEKGSDDQPLTFEQLQSLATSRASRSALRNKGIDLVKLHFASKNVTQVEFSGPPRSQYENLLREAHALGREVGLINDADAGDAHPKRLWYGVLRMRYNVTASNRLNVEDLADFVAFLKSLRPAKAAA